MKIGKEKCRCGDSACDTWWLTGVGHFVQGSGFTKKEAEEIIDALNSADTVSSMGTRYTVDGTAPDGTLQGDGEMAPFRVFDVLRQRHLMLVHSTREEAAAHRMRLMWADAGVYTHERR